MRNKIAGIEIGLAKLNGRDKTRFVAQEPTEQITRDLTDIAAFLRRNPCNLIFLLERQFYAHGSKVVPAKGNIDIDGKPALTARTTAPYPQTP